MDPISQKQQVLLETLNGYGNVAVAFSAGVDSAVVCKAAALACSKSWAITAVSPSVAEGEVEEAARVAAAIGIPHAIVRTQEFENPNYVSNPVDRCRFCKTELYSRIAARQSEIGFDIIANGANTDDLGDYRPGMQAATEFNIRSPLIEAECNKDDVRALAKKWGLSVWDKPASPCLSSRIAYGVEVTPERLQRIDKSEQFLRTQLNVRELRVRCEANDLARIELPANVIATAIDVRTAISDHLKSLGFKRVTIDLEGFRTGSMNESLNLIDLQI
jgi:uncharacterized protein